MTELYKTDLQQIIEYKEATEKQKAEKKALRITIAAILGSLALGGIAMFAGKHAEASNNNTYIELEKEADEEIQSRIR